MGSPIPDPMLHKPDKPQHAPSSPRVEDVVEWDVANWSHALGFWVEHSALLVTAESRALELGTRHGGLSLWLASRRFNVVCTDIEYPAATARRLHASYDVADRVSYRRADATAIAIDGPFDVVCFKSMLGAIGRGGIESQQLAIDEMHRVLRPGGEVWFAENLRASPLHRILRRVFVPWGTSWRYLTVPELKKMFAGFKTLDIATIGFFAAFGRTERQRRFLSVLDKGVLGRLVPYAWRYIAIGVARK